MGLLDLLLIFLFLIYSPLLMSDDVDQLLTRVLSKIDSHSFDNLLPRVLTKLNGLTFLDIRHLCCRSKWKMKEEPVLLPREPRGNWTV